MTLASRTWAEATQAIVARCEVAAAFKHDAVFNPDGADALGKLIKEMARLIDEEIVARRGVS